MHRQLHIFAEHTCCLLSHVQKATRNRVAVGPRLTTWGPISLVALVASGTSCKKLHRDLMLKDQNRCDVFDV